MMKKKYNVLIVDDEFLARKLLSEYVSKVEILNLVDTCPDATSAMQVLNKENIDILFLDIQMPDISGMEMLKLLNNRPSVVLTTAYSEYAVDAFALGVVDYLLKPFDYARFMQAINKIVNKNVIESQTETNSLNDYILVKADYKLYKVNYEDLLYIEGQHEYVTFHTTTKRITALYSLRSLEETLPKDKFVRTHKSFIVSIKNIEDIDKLNVTVAGNKIPIGASYREALIERLS
ncbi:MAG: response regulator transcription factor [Bacteroidales bacterium]|nr:response regulator transcription factor [Bacteroidales bacterium]MBO5848825.1 response regulator transcription factor [Bacteroidales bacterium]